MKLKSILTGLLILLMVGMAGAQQVIPSRSYAPFLKLGRQTPNTTTDTLYNPGGTLTYNGKTVAFTDSNITGTAAAASNLILNPSPANLGYNGEYWTATAGENLTIGQVCYQGPDGLWWKAKGTLPTAWATGTVYAVGNVVKPTANQNVFAFCSAVTGDAKSSATTEPTWGTTIGATLTDNNVTWIVIDTESLAGRMMATGTINAAASGIFLAKGFLRNDGWSTTNPGQDLYLDASTAGAFTQTRPSASGNRVQILGRAAAQAKTVFFNPNTVIIQVP